MATSRRKKLKIVFNSPVILGFVFACFIVQLFNTISNGRTGEILFMTYHSSLKNPLTYIRFFTHVLGHSGWEHLISNMVYVLLLGPLLEEKYGSELLLWVIGITALITGLINYLFFWNVALCGASGVCFAFILLASFTGFKEGEIPLTFILVAVFFIGQQIFDSFTVKQNISYMAHIIGGIIGGIIGYILNLKI